MIAFEPSQFPNDVTLKRSPMCLRNDERPEYLNIDSVELLPSCIAATSCIKTLALVCGKPSPALPETFAGRAAVPGSTSQPGAHSETFRVAEHISPCNNPAALLRVFPVAS